jgi:hypothetical protein
MPIGRQQVAKHIPTEANTRNNRSSIARQCLQYTHATIEKVLQEEFSMWFTYVQCWEMDVFCMGLPRDSISSTEQNENKNKNGVSPRQSRRKGLPKG